MMKTTVIALIIPALASLFFLDVPMKNLLVIISLALPLVGLVFVGMFIANDRSFDPCMPAPKKDAQRKTGSRIKIGIVGDSWVAGHKMDGAVLDAVSSAGVDAAVVSSGQPGGTSRDIYRNLTSTLPRPYSSRHILVDEDIDYLLVMAGVNDTVEHIGRDFYAHHMVCIMRAAQSQGIQPVILEVPEYGIETTPPKSFLNYAKRRIYRVLFDHNDQNVIPAYRQALKERMTAEMMARISMVEFAPLTTDYSGSLALFENPNHLSADGYRKLGQIISQTIVEDCRNRLKRQRP